jgi:hypothetical protein
MIIWIPHARIHLEELKGAHYSLDGGRQDMTY